MVANLSHISEDRWKKLVSFAFVNMIQVNIHLYLLRAKVYYNLIMTTFTNVVFIFESHILWGEVGGSVTNPDNDLGYYTVHLEL